MVNIAKVWSAQASKWRGGVERLSPGIKLNELQPIWATEAVIRLFMLIPGQPPFRRSHTSGDEAGADKTHCRLACPPE